MKKRIPFQVVSAVNDEAIYVDVCSDEISVMAELKHFATSFMEPTRVALRLFLPHFVTFGGVTDVHSRSNYKPDIKNASNGVDIVVS